jgi:transposase
MKQQQYVGIDLHRRRSVIVRVDEHGGHSAPVRIDNDAATLAAEVAKAGVHPEVVLEATYGWYWAVDVLQEIGATVHLAHPLGLNWGHRRRKDDVVDATDLVDMLRLGRLPEAWIAPPAIRELREMVRYRAKLVCLRSGLKAQVHAVLAKEGVHVPVSDLFGVAGQRLLDEVALGRAYTVRVESLRDLIEVYDRQVDIADREVRAALDGHSGWRAIQAIPGVGPVLGAVFVAEIGDVQRFPTARHLCSWAGLTPSHHESDTTVVTGHITKQGSRLVRWAAVEAAQKTGDFLRTDYRRIAERRNNRKIARVAVARKIVTLVYYGLRDGHIRCLEPEPEVAA